MIKTIRPFNLLIVAITQLIVYYKCIDIYFLSAINGNQQVLSFAFLALFIVISILITMSGYIINEYYDKETDAINQKTKSINLSKSFLFKYYISVVLSGLLLSIYVAVYTNNLHLFWIYPFAIVLLFLYSRYWKSRGLIGNIVVSIFCAFVAGMLVIAEYPNFELINEAYYGIISGFQIIAFYMAFAFFTTLYREVIKDIEDIKGDIEVGHTTLPISIGIEKTKAFAQIQGLLLIISIFAWLYFALSEINIIANVLLFMMTIIPIGYSILKLPKCKSEQDYKHISNLIKLVMLGGLIYLIII